MANNVNLGTARILTAAIRHTLNNDYRFNTLGAIAAVNDPSFSQLRMAINPKTVDPTNRGWRNIGSRQVPVLHVNVGYTPQAAAVSALTERTRTDGSPIEASNAVTVDVPYDYHIEKHFKSDVRKELLEPRAQQYIEQYLAGKMRLDATMSVWMAQIGLKMYAQIEPVLIRPYNNYVLTQLISRVGKNKAYPVAATPTADAPVVEVVGFKTVGPEQVAVKNPFEAFMNTKTANKFAGKPVVIGGMKWLQWQRNMNYMVANDTGINYGKIYNEMPWIFYYDESIDTVFGEGTALVMDSGAVAFETISEHDRTYSYIKAEDFDTDDTSYGVAYMNISQYNELEKGLANIPASLPLAMDIRVQRNQDSNDLPVKIWKPAISAGNFIRPLGFFTSDTSNILNKVSGVFAFKMVDSESV